MCVTIHAQSASFSDESILKMLRKLNPSERFDALELVYYPYYFISYVLQLKKLWKSYTQKIGITIDSVSGVCSIADSPLRTEITEVAQNQLLPCEMTENEVIEAAGSFLNEMIILKLKVLRVPEIDTEKCKLFYRPYWVIKNEKTNSNANQTKIIVDAVSGGYYLSE